MPGFTTTGGTLPVNIVSKLLPDIVIVNTNKKSFHLVELTVPFERNIPKAHERKTHKYADLVLDISQNGYNCNLTCIEIGSRGLVTPETNKRISEIFSSIKAKPPKSLKKELSKIAILSSYTIWNARHEPSWGGGGGVLTNLTSSCNFCLCSCSFAVIIFCCFCMSFVWPCTVSWSVLLTMVHVLGLDVYNFCACLIFLCLYILLIKIN